MLREEGARHGNEEATRGANNRELPRRHEQGERNDGELTRREGGDNNVQSDVDAAMESDDGQVRLTCSGK